MRKDFNKIVIVSLCDTFSEKIGKTLSQSLDMMFCNTKDLVEYELIDRNMLKIISTKEYLDNAEKKVIKQISSFENVVVTIDFDYLTHNLNILKEEGLIVFLKLSKKFVKENENGVNTLVYNVRSFQLEQIADLTLKIQNTTEKFVCDNIIKSIGGIL